MPSGWPRRTATTRSIRASRSRLPNRSSRSTPVRRTSSALVRIDDEVAASVRRRQEDIEPCPGSPRSSMPTGLAVDRSRELAELAVEEDPVVELAAPVLEIRRRRRASATCGKPPGTSGPSTATAAAPSRAPSMTSIPRSSAVARTPGVSAVPDRLEVERRSRSRHPSSVRTQPPAGVRTHARSPRRAAPYWPSSRSVATYASQRKSVPAR